VHPRAKVTIDSLYEVVYQNVGTKMNDLYLCLAVLSYQGHVNHSAVQSTEHEYLSKSKSS